MSTARAGGERFAIGPRLHSAWTWGWNIAPSPKVWTTDTIPGRKPFSSTAATMSPRAKVSCLLPPNT